MKYIYVPKGSDNMAKIYTLESSGEKIRIDDRKLDVMSRQELQNVILKLTSEIDYLKEQQGDKRPKKYKKSEDKFILNLEKMRDFIDDTPEHSITELCKFLEISRKTFYNKYKEEHAKYYKSRYEIEFSTQ